MLRALLAAAAILGTVSSPMAQSLKPDEIFSSIAVQPITAPDPVLGADDRVHLAYELLISNASTVFVTIDKVEAVDKQGHRLSSLEGDGLKAMTSMFTHQDRLMPPGGTAIVFMDVSFARNEALPERVAARITATRQAAGADGRPAPLPADFPFPATFSFTGAPTTIGKPAIVVAPPLRGKNWVAVNGCCDAITSHRGAVMAVNGVLRVSERFAIDWIQLNDQNRLFTADVSNLEGYAFYGTPVYSVADGVVANIYDEADEQVPGAAAKGIRQENIGGNMLVIDIGNGAYAFYAHLQRGSMKVKLGDKVRTGDVLGLLGNTGNSDAPHLHFHVMDGPSPLDANGLPYVFTRFTGRGVMPDEEDAIFKKGEAAVIDRSRLSGKYVDQLPMNLQVVDFDEPRIAKGHPASHGPANP